MIILGIETSCDETSAAVYDGNKLKSNVISTQLIHKRYGGVVPELASREHLRNIIPVVNDALKQADVTFPDLDCIAVTSGPGLIGSLMIGVSYAKALSYTLNIPIVKVNHIEAHLWAPVFENPHFEPPFVGLIISGGHTQLWYVKGFGNYELLGETLDDAVGEAFDKTAKMLDLDYPGGPEIEKLSKNGNPVFHSFPRPYLRSSDLNFSFSGLKTSVLYYLQGLSREYFEIHKQDIAASFQQAVVDTLISKALKAVKQKKVDTVVLGGGVSANTVLKEQIQTEAGKKGIKVYIPSLEYCTDNAAMITYIGYKKVQNNPSGDGLEFSAMPSLKMV